MDGQDPQLEARDRMINIAFGVMALLCLAVGLVLYLFPDIVGLDEEMARYVAIAFLIVGFSDYLVLRFWKRFMRRR